MGRVEGKGLGDTYIYIYIYTYIIRVEGVEYLITTVCSEPLPIITKRARDFAARTLISGSQWANFTSTRCLSNAVRRTGSK
jgi:hypothetical protein